MQNLRINQIFASNSRNNSIYSETLYRHAFSFGPFVRLILSSGSSLPIALPTLSQEGLSKGFGTGLLSIFSLKNPPKHSQLPQKVYKIAAKKEPRVTQMNHSGLSNFTQKPISNAALKGQNWEQNWDDFGWGRDMEIPRNSLVTKIIT